VAKSSPLKVSVECPHCGFKQQEYAAAKSTMCRQCGAHFSPSEPKRSPAVIPRATPRSDAPPAPQAPSLLRRFDGLWKTQRNRLVECFECKRRQEVSGAASSTICPSCSAHIDLRDYKITGPFSRSIRTTGDVHVTARGDLSSSNIRCRRAIVEGRLRGNMQCAESARVDLSGKIPGRLCAREVIIEKRAHVQFFRRLRVGNLEVRGKMAGEVIAEGTVTIRKHGVLDGNVTAKAINVEKGGLFAGQLVIGNASLEQAELLPGQTGATMAEGPVPLAQPLPAT
jgi:cytoskeletal protein CcmA (bactofilin family)